MLFRSYKLSVLPDVLAVVHLETMKSNSPIFASRVESSRLTILQKHEAEIRDELGRYAASCFRGNTFWLIAEAKFRSGDFAGGLKYFLRAVVVFPLMSPRRYAQILVVALGLTGFVQRLGLFLWRLRRR